MFKFWLYSFIVLLFSCSEQPRDYEIKKRNKGYVGMARKNPFLAAMQFLEEYQFVTKVGASARFDDVEFDTVILPASSVVTRAQMNRISRFVKRGGHLICLLGAGEREYLDFYPEPGSKISETEVLNIQQFAQIFDISIEFSEEPEYSYDGERLMREEELRKYEIPYSNLFSLEFAQQELSFRAGGAWWIIEGSKSAKSLLNNTLNGGEERINYNHLLGSVIRDKEDTKHKFFSKRFGMRNGRVSFIADGRMIRNPHIATQDHASLLLMLVEQSRGNRVLFSYGKSRSFYSLLLENFSYGLVGFGLLIFFWIFSKWHRFGPISDSYQNKPMSYLASLEAQGHFYWNQKESSFLISSLQIKVQKLAGLRALSADERKEKLEHVAERIESSYLNIKDALREEKSRDAISFIQAVRILQKIIQYYE